MKGSSNIQKVRDIMTGRPHLWPAIIAAVMLLIAIAPLPYGYYQLLRWIICGIAVFLIYIAYSYKKAWVAVIFCIIAILFNPIFTIHFDKNIWQWIDCICGVVFIASVFFLRKPINSE
jgi:hypothetical protein